MTPDALAQIAIDRYRRAKDYRTSTPIYQGLSTDSLIARADAQIAREYTPSDAERMQTAFGFTPSRYYPLSAFKVQAVTAWRMNLVAPNLDALFTVAPTPNPSLDKESLTNIRNQVRKRLLDRMIEAGVADPQLLLDAKGQPARQLEAFLREQVRDLKKVEESLALSLARQASDRTSAHMQDVLVQGGWRQAYQLYATDAATYGMGVMRFVPAGRIPMLMHTSKGSAWQWQTQPQFVYVPFKDFFPICDSDSLDTNTGNTQYSRITKAQLIDLSRNPHYDKSAIAEIVEHFDRKPLDWLAPETTDTTDGWLLDQTIPLLIHEGFFSGTELADRGITGFDALDYVTARVEVCGGRTIRAEILKLPNGTGRTFFAAPYNKIGAGLLDVIGLPAQLWDNEQRINTLLHLFEHNVDWASRPPILVNTSVFADPADALSVVPGGNYDVQERFGAAGVMPEPMRAMTTVSAQYHLLLTQVNAIIRDSDEITGLPGYALGGAGNMGSASLGEYSQRVSNSLRIIQQILLNEDMFFIEPAMKALFHTVVDTEPELLKGADVQVVVRGTTGLMQREASAQRLQSLLGLVMQDQSGMTPQSVKQFVLRQVFEQAGVPTDALGVTDPMIESALAAAAVAPPGTFGPMGPQVPQLDGRSRAAFSTGALAAPSGAPLGEGVGMPMPGA